MLIWPVEKKIRITRYYMHVCIYVHMCIHIYEYCIYVCKCIHTLLYACKNNYLKIHHEFQRQILQEFEGVVVDVVKQLQCSSMIFLHLFKIYHVKYSHISDIYKSKTILLISNPTSNINPKLELRLIVTLNLICKPQLIFQ